MVEKRESARLTEKRLARAVAAKKKAILRDPSVQGFGVQVGPRGGATFFLRYGGKSARRYLTIGRWSDEFDVENARKLAVELAGRIARGEDPVAARKQDAARAVTFAEWTATYLKRTSRLRKRKAEPAAYLAVAVAKWGRRAVGSISRGDVLSLREKVAEDSAKKVRARRAKRARALGWKLGEESAALDGHTSANRFLFTLAACFAAAVAEGTIATNPAKGIKALPEAPPRSRVLTDDEMGSLLEALDGEDAVTSAVFHVLIETGARVSEVLSARWSDLDLAAGLWTIPSPKSGRKETVPLPSVTVERLKELPRISEWVIPARNDFSKRRFDVRQDWLRLKERASLGDANIHDVRRSYGLAVARSSGLLLASRLLRHRDVKVTSRVYTPMDLGLQREATERRAALLPFKKKSVK